MPTYRDAAIVLRGYSFGEADRVIVLLTQDHGKVRAVAKGVRKTTSKFGARLEPMSHVEVQLHRGRELDIVQQVSLVETYRGLRASLESLTDALSMCEAVDRMCHDREPVQPVYRALVGAIRTLDRERNELVLGAFLLRLLALDGVGPSGDECATCGGPLGERPAGFNVARGGAECASCHRGVRMSPSAGDLMQLVLSGRIGEALARAAQPTSDAARASREVTMIARSAAEHHLEKRLRAMSVFEPSQPADESFDRPSAER
jgi:DNA repair protein RecO (recombination protein O)